MRWQTLQAVAKKYGGFENMEKKKVFYRITGKPTPELIEKYDEAEDIFYRFQNSRRKLTSRSESWGMIYKSKAEAIREGCDILTGKSCVETFEELKKWMGQFATSRKDDDYYCVLIFKGYNTQDTGHDGETVAKYYSKVDVWSVQDTMEYFDWYIPWEK